MDFYILQTINGISFAMILFLMAAGLSIIFGLMKIVNLAHGSFYTLAVYIALAAIKYTNHYMLSLITGVVAVTLIGTILQRFFLQRFQYDELSQVLLTIGFLFIIADLAQYIWGGQPRLLPRPALFQGTIAIRDIEFPVYRLAMIIIGILIAIGLWLFLEKTRMGALIRAGVDDAEMARGVGINTSLLFTSIFGLGAAMCAFSGIIAGSFIGVYAGLEWDILLLALAVLLIGGLGSLKGAFVGSLLIGLADTFGKTFIPELAMFIIFGSVAIVLAFKPSGFFGKP